MPVAKPNPGTTKLGTTQPLFEIFIDGGCSMCAHESRLMARLDRGRGRLGITDIASREFEPPTDDQGDRIGYETLMRSIHGRYPDGRVVHGVEVFRASYAAIGWGWLWAPTAWPIIRPVMDRFYTFFAAWRFKRRLRQGCGISTAHAAA